MEKLTPHPSREELNAYSLGQLPEERAVAIDSHISECEPCCETIVELSSEDTFAGLLQEAGGLTADHDRVALKSSYDPGEIPAPLTEHPRYEVLGLIGKGGMGDVYQAMHRKMERRVALKVINRDLFQKAEAVNRFHREVKTAAQLSHPNIVTAHDADQAGEFHFMVMEFVDGVDLSRIVKDQGGLPIADACDYIRQAALGLQHAHERGMVHRDIKPHNLMITSAGTVKILDFGLASFAPEARPISDSAEARSDLTVAGAIMGTPDFISPEQANDPRKVDIRSDIYSLGATFYYLLSGRTPFVDGSVMHKLKSHAQFEPESLKTLRNDVPDELVAIVSTMMAKAPDDRYLTPREVGNALESFLRTWQPEGAPILAKPTAGGGNGSSPHDRRIFRMTTGRALLATGILVASVFAAVGYHLSAHNSLLRVTVTAQEDNTTIDTHPLTIVDTSGKKPSGGTNRTHQNDATGITTHTFESANGRYMITLVDKVLTVNGDRYTLENPQDSIRIVDDRVEITRITELAQDGADELKRLQGIWEVIAFTQDGMKERVAEDITSMQLQINDDRITSLRMSAKGEPSKKVWGRIEFNRTSNPKSIDIMNPEIPGGRLLGIYELKDGALSICFAEPNVIDAAESMPVKRPATFSSPSGSKNVLLECRRKKSKSHGERSTSPNTNEQLESEDSDMLSWMFKVDPELQQDVADKFIARGDYEGAKRVMSLVEPENPKAAAAFHLAKIQEQKGEIEKAADSYLEAYTFAPSLLSEKQLPLLEKAGRLDELLEVLTEKRLSKLGYFNRVEQVVSELLKNQSTREAGFELLKRIAFTQPDEFRSLIGSIPKRVLSEAPDPGAFLRRTLLPTNLVEQGAGWEIFGIKDYFGRPDVNEYGGWGPLQGLPPVIQGNPRAKAALAELTEEVEYVLAQHPGWKAGVAVLGYLQAEQGNVQQAVALFEKALADQESPMPPNSAWAFALVLEGKGKLLDQTVIQLYERKISGPKDEGRQLRYWPSKELAQLYAKYGCREEARELLFGLAEPETEVICTPGYRNTDPNSCVRCHQTDRSIDNYTVLSSELSDIGYPVDAYLQLARIDASYHNLLSSDNKWAESNAIDDFDPESKLRSYLHAKTKASNGITPATVLEALRQGRFTNQDKYNNDLDLATSIRGERGEPAVFSPVVEVFKLTTQTKGDEAAIANLDIDQLLTDEFMMNRGNIETGIAATIFAFLRNDVEVAKKRTQHLVESVPGANTPPKGIDLWLVARYALANESTQDLGEKLADRALAAAKRQSNPLLKKVIQAGLASTHVEAIPKKFSERNFNDN